MTFAIRTAATPVTITAAVRREIAAIDPELPLYSVRTIEDLMDRSLSGRRTPMVLAIAFGSLALLLAAVGIYGVLAYQVTQRTREMGIRMALGSDAGAIFRLVLGEGAALLAIGFGLGLVGAFALRGTLASQLYEVGSMDPTVIAIVTVVLCTVGLVACAAPARRAARIDPLIALPEH